MRYIVIGRTYVLKESEPGAFEAGTRVVAIDVLPDKRTGQVILCVPEGYADPEDSDVQWFTTASNLMEVKDHGRG